MYADFDFYATQYFGQTIQPSDFDWLATRASTFLDSCTMGRAKSHADLHELKMACCALAEQYQIIEAARKTATSAAAVDGAELQSESVGSWSQSYRSGGSTATEALTVTQNAQASLLDIAKQYLGHAGLLRARGFMA